MTDPDRKLAKRAARGDADAIAVLYDRYRSRIFGFLVRISGRQAAEDVFQEVWIAVIRRIDSFDPRRGSFSGWIHGIAANAAVDRFRRERVREADSLDDPERGETLPSPGPSPESAALAAPLGDALVAALDRLEPDRRAAVLLRHHLGMTYAEIAGSLGIPEGTAKSMVHRGVSELRASLEGWSHGRS